MRGDRDYLRVLVVAGMFLAEVDMVKRVVGLDCTAIFYQIPPFILPGRARRPSMVTRLADASLAAMACGSDSASDTLLPYLPDDSASHNPS